MGRTIHEAAAEDELAAMLDSPRRAVELNRMADRLQAGTCPDWFTAMIGQTRERAAYWPLPQVAAFTSVMTRLAFGKVARRRIPVGATPGPDADREGNADRLSRVPAPFVAHLDMRQNGADSDGVLEWTEPVTIWRSTAVPVRKAHVLHSAIQAPFQVRAGAVPLEVGYTKPSRTFAHLLMDGAVARWAYGDEEIHLLVDLERAGSRMGTRPLPGDVHDIRVL
ncbi:hypothetical protein [Streptomyces antibioticus]|uniref:hypothetical protein n=1 Tax=Streptomyces antibioticus TaxID=1890 RepID=UPI003D74532F